MLQREDSSFTPMAVSPASTAGMPHPRVQPPLPTVTDNTKTVSSLLTPLSVSKSQPQMMTTAAFKTTLLQTSPPTFKKNHASSLLRRVILIPLSTSTNSSIPSWPHPHVPHLLSQTPRSNSYHSVQTSFHQQPWTTQAPLSLIINFYDLFAGNLSSSTSRHRSTTR
ncbi:hypothetical protein BC829DRAFT_407248 [Chytridium lagenaria]|nr:hypothetical protein BC829DRAFT_407248 [Chytridium lagenaria]